MTNLIKALNLQGAPEFDYLMVFKRVTGEGDYEGIFSLSDSSDLGNMAKLAWHDIDESQSFESELIEPIVFEDRELGYLRALHQREDVYSPSSRAEFSPLVRQLASLFLSAEGDDYRRSMERNIRIFEWLVDVQAIAPKKITWLGIYFHSDFFFYFQL